MKRLVLKRTLGAWCMVCILFFSISGCEKQKDEKFESKFIKGLTLDNYPRVDGSTSTYPLNVIIACELLGINYEWLPNPYGHGWGVEPNLKNNEKFLEKIKSSQTHQSFINLIDKNADLSLSARKKSQDEMNYANAASISLIETPIALDAFIFIVHPNNPIKSLTIEQIQGIYTGEITNWKEVGGNDATINPYVRNANSGSQELMELLVMRDLEIIELPTSPDVVFTMYGAFDAVSRDINGICYSVFYYKEQILRATHTKTIAIEDIYPDKNTIGNKTYPLVAEVYAVIRNDLDQSSMAYKVYEFLQTEEGKQIINKSGYLSN